MAQYKGIYLNRDMIKQTIEEFKDSTTVEVLDFVGPPKCKKFKVKVPGHHIESTISCYVNGDGDVTLTLQECRNKELGNQIIEHIVKETAFDAKIKGTIYIHSFPEEHLDDLIQYVTDEYNATLVNTLNRTNGYTKVVQSKYGDKCYLNYFTSNKGFNVQGKSGLMKSQILEGLSVYLPYQDVVESTLSTYNIVDVDKTEAEKLFDARLPYATSFLHNTVKIVLLPAIFTQRLEGDTTDFSFITFPAFRGLEGFMKQILHDDGLNVDYFGNVFEPVGSTGTHILKQTTKNVVTCIYKQAVLEKCYSHLKQTRHLLFHVDGTLIGTTIIEDIQVAKSYIDDVFDLIDKSVQCITERNLTLLP